MLTVDDSAFPHTKSLTSQITFLCNYGLLAPSVHNIQPWEFHPKANQLVIRLSAQRWLREGDATGRQSWISIGTCIANIEIAAAHFGYSVRLERGVFGRHDHPDDIALTFSKETRKPTDSSRFDAIRLRFSDRSLFDGKPIEPNNLRYIAASSIDSATVYISTNRAVINKAAELTGRGIAAAFSNPAFRRELADLIAPHERTSHGFTPKALGLNPLRGALEPHLVRYGLHRKAQAQLEKRRIASCSALIAVATTGDTPLHWIDAGRAYERAILAATARGLRNATTAAVVEAFDFHLDLEKLLGTSKRLQVLGRLGYSNAPIHHSPRLPLSTVLY
jgi:hypothetical protein